MRNVPNTSTVRVGGPLGKVGFMEPGTTTPNFELEPEPNRPNENPDDERHPKDDHPARRTGEEQVHPNHLPDEESPAEVDPVGEPGDYS